MADQTPMVRQYQQIKSSHHDSILFFRLGDFYEMFYDDAILASRVLELTLTGRGKDANRMPMCGIPYHAAEGYIAKLIEKGYKVAICEQVEDPKLAQGVVKREVIKVITPGTVLLSSMLSEKTNNYLIAINHEKGKYGIAVIDSSTGEFKVSSFQSFDDLQDEIKRIEPREILVSDLFPEENAIISNENCLTAKFKDIYDVDAAQKKLIEHFKVASLSSFGIDRKDVCLGAAAAIIDYLKQTQKSSLGHINAIKYYFLAEYMFLDPVTRRNLELTQTVRDKSLDGSLLSVIDRTKTSMGGRLLRRWILQPLLSIDKIVARQDAVAELANDGMLRADLSKLLPQIFDIERLTGKIASESASAKDIVALKESLLHIPGIKALLSSADSSLLKEINLMPGFDDLTDFISRAINDDPPFVLKEGGLIREGFNPELDELKQTTRGGKEWIARLEAEERKRTGIKSLKVGFTKVFGYYIEVTNANLNDVPSDYIRKQTLVNAERFITPGLKEKETAILHADERMKNLEYQIFCEVRSQIAVYTKALQKTAQVIAQIDVFLSLSESAVENRYCRPKIAAESSSIKLKNSRHPVVEKKMGEFNFVPNDIELDSNLRFLLITGPNMGGKSTYMRQIALICLMAQIGSFVPAKEAEIGIIDRIFTRIGAMDDIYSGQSTFMVEMIETANILNNATENSLIILDEIGRGTATFDGMSIAAAVAEFIHRKIKAKTLFATHYHEITQLTEKYAEMKNISVAVRDEGDTITFLHRLQAGSADKSYGIQVAKLAGLPREVIGRAKEIYDTLEMVENDLGQVKDKRGKRKKAAAKDSDQASLF